MMTEVRNVRSYGRVKGRALKPRQARLVETLLPRIEIPAEGAIDLEALFAEPGATGATAPEPGAGAAGSPAILEIGFGGGEHLVAQAQARPDRRFLGVEPFLNGVASCLRHVEETGVSNVRLSQGDARIVVARLPDASLERVYILFPDPWPKRRHWKRRLIQRDFIADLARLLRPGGDVRVATDWKHYAAWSLALFLKEPRFAWCAERADDWRSAWADHVATRYEAKRLGDTAPIFLRFQRLSAALGESQ